MHCYVYLMTDGTYKISEGREPVLEFLFKAWLAMDCEGTIIKDRYGTGCFRR